MNREDIVNAFAAFKALRDFHCSKAGPASLRFLRSGLVHDLVDVHMPSSYHGNHSERSDVLDHLTPEAFAGYFALVDKYLGRTEAERLSDEWARINSVNGVTIHVENNEDDPFSINFYVNDPIANEWAEKHGSLDGGTWECCDGPEFVYDTGMWHEGIWESLKKDGFDLDFSQWGDPEPEDHETAKHINECDDCRDDWNFDKARDCMTRDPIIVVADQVIQKLRTA